MNKGDTIAVLDASFAVWIISASNYWSLLDNKRPNTEPVSAYQPAIASLGLCTVSSFLKFKQFDKRQCATLHQKFLVIHQKVSMMFHGAATDTPLSKHRISLTAKGMMFFTQTCQEKRGIKCKQAKKYMN